ncbi:MAG: ADP-heptose--LPS heptosyltransferase, partial [Patescibacteria group bacterium]|nr:ADP-heptose--LPS heptosyltransferase [Patescibacteria group bacterium]
MENPLINICDSAPVHFLESYCRFLGEAIGLKIHCTVNRPYLYLSDQEKSWMSQVQQLTGRKFPYWLICSNTKTDYTVKGWGFDNYQRLVDMLRGRIQFVQVGAAEHKPQKLRGVIDLVGQTDHRQLIRLAANAEGGVGPESYLMHIFAGLSKPFVAILSGFLPPSWVYYPTVTQIHRHGKLPCCQEKACWRARTVPLNDGDKEKDQSLCAWPVLGAEPIPKCMAMIPPEEVADAIEAFYDGGALSNGLPKLQ